MSTHEHDSKMKDEYDFSHGVRGKHAEAYARGSNVVVLEPEVAEEFPDSKSVNEAVRSLLPIIKNHSRASQR